MLSREEIEQYAAEGREAFERGMRLDACPYHLTTAPAQCWLRGYQNAAYGAAHLEKHHD
jgi:ribosome modulation factor